MYTLINLNVDVVVVVTFSQRAVDVSLSRNAACFIGAAIRFYFRRRKSRRNGAFARNDNSLLPRGQ